MSKKLTTLMTCTASANHRLFTPGKKYKAEGNATEGGYVQCDIGIRHRITPTHTMTQSLYTHSNEMGVFIFQIRA